MKSEQEIREKLKNVKQSHLERKHKSGDKPCKPSGAPDTDHIAAVSINGMVDGLEWVLEE